MVFLKRLGIILAAAIMFVVLRGVCHTWVRPGLEQTLWPHSGRLAEVIATGLVMLVIALPWFRADFAIRFRMTSVLLVPLAFLVVNLAFFESGRSMSALSTVSLVLGAFAGGLNEEFFLRGFAFVWGGANTPRFTVALSGLIFGLLHFLNLTTGAPLSEVGGTVVLATQAGIIFGIVRVATGSIFWGAWLHGAINATFEFTNAESGIYQLLAIALTLLATPLSLLLFCFHPAMRHRHAVASPTIPGREEPLASINLKSPQLES